jgi:hypothetical protein
VEECGQIRHWDLPCGEVLDLSHWASRLPLPSHTAGKGARWSPVQTTPLSKQRIHWLHEQLEEFDEAEVAATGARVRDAICPCLPPSVDPYERTLAITLDVLTFRLRAQEHGQASLGQRLGKALSEELDLVQVAAGTSICMACEHMPYFGSVLFEPEAA